MEPRESKSSIFTIYQEKTLKTWTDNISCFSSPKNKEKKQQKRSTQKSSNESSIGLTCRSCNLEFSSRNEQTRHFKDEFHRHNLRRTVQKQSSISAEEYLELKRSCSEELKEETQDSSTLSDDSEEDDSANEQSEGDNTTFVKSGATAVFFLAGKRLTICSAILPRNLGEDGNELDNSSLGHFDIFHQLASLGHQQLWAILLLRSGRFAGAVFEGQNILVHKCFKRYTTRRKAGGAQSACDGKKKVRSAGSQLRRYGEKQLEEEVTELLGTKWHQYLQACQLIFYSCSKSLLHLIFKDINKKDPRIRTIPFVTERPTLEEVKKTHTRLAQVTVEDVASEPQNQNERLAELLDGNLVVSNDKLSDSKQEEAEAPRAPEIPVMQKPVPDVPAFQQEESEDMMKLFAACASKESLGALLSQLQTYCLTPYWSDDGSLIQQELDNNASASVLGPWGSGGSSPLHVAAAADNFEAITLLLQYGADPACLDWQGRPAYFLCPGKKSKEAFRKARAILPDRWDWAAAAVPEALTEEAIKKKKEKEREKRRRQKERKKQEKEKMAKQPIETQKSGVVKAQGATPLPDTVCALCELPLLGMKAVIKNGKRYCGLKCVNVHKRRLIAEAAEKRTQGV